MMETPAQYTIPEPPKVQPYAGPVPAVVPNLPAEVYHATHAMSAGGLKRMRQSPAHFFGMQLDPNRPPPGDPTAAMKNGTLVHCCTFEPDEVDRRYVVLPDDAPKRPTEAQRNAAKPSSATLDAIDWWARFEATHPGAEVIDRGQLEAAQRQAAAIRALPEVGALLREGSGEDSVFWIDQETGLLCKCRPDWTSPAGDGVILVDGKTTSDASPQGFSRSVWNLDYHLQAAWYSDGYEAATGKRVHGFVFATAENTWPHIGAAYMLDDEVLDWARRENRRLLNLYAECVRTGVWPGYQQTIQPLTLPAWAMKEINE